MQRRIVLKIEYDGTDFCGWQIQPNGITVQQVLQDAIFTLTGEKTEVVGSGRTDSGVHAKGQIAHFDTNSTIPPEKFYLAINQFLPSGIRVVESFEVEKDFHARYSAKKKTYEYKMYISEVEKPLKERYMTRISGNLNFEDMEKATKFFIGTHDFKCFLASNSSVKNTERTIYTATFTKNEDEITFTVTGNGFLYNMVRIMVGTLIKVGEGKIKPCDIEKIIEKKERLNAGITMQAKGLTLLGVEY